MIEEILKMMSSDVINQILAEVKNEKYFSIMLDATSDVSRLEQVSIYLLYVTDEFVVKKIFVGFCETGDGKAEKLINIVKGVLIRFNLNVSNVRGQCYDGAATVSDDI